MSSTQGPRPLGRPWNNCIFLWAGTIKRRHHSIWIPLLSFKKGSREYCIYAYWILLIVLEKCEILSTFFSFLVKLIQHKNCWHLCLPPSSKTLHWHELQMYLLNSSQMSSSVERKTSEISMKWSEEKWSSFSVGLCCLRSYIYYISSSDVWRVWIPCDMMQ